MPFWRSRKAAPPLPPEKPLGLQSLLEGVPVRTTAQPATARDSEAILFGWAMREVAPWQFQGVPRKAAMQVYDDLNASQPCITRFEFAHGHVSVAPKPHSVAQDEGYLYRTEKYLAFFRAVVPNLPAGFVATLCLSVDDKPPDRTAVPVFGFQKPRGSKVLLLPDLDFLIHDFYRPNFADPYQYREKRAQAVFAGATTGTMMNASMARALGTPRLRAAAYFNGNPRVDFRLPRVVQCTEPEAHAFLSAQAFCQKPTLEWDEQFASRFLISIDGNGATCSRVAIALASNSVLLKYESDDVLYYFGGMQPWVHYVPVAESAEVEKILDLETRQPARFEQIAASGRRFAQDYLGREAAQRYTALLLQAYAASFADP
jgi:hypothetical protein